MQTLIIDGLTLAAHIKQDIAAKIETLRKQDLPPPCLAVILVGTDPPSALYVKKKSHACRDVGIKSQTYHLPANSPTLKNELIDLLQRLSSDNRVHGILVQLPLPKSVENSMEILQEICPLKDVDGLTAWNQGRLSLNLSGLFPCTPLGCMSLIDTIMPDLVGVRATVIGHSALVGSPVAKMLLLAGATVITVHALSKNKQQLCAESDLIVSAAGAPHLLAAGWVKPGATVIDVGTKHVAGKLTGDANYQALLGTAHAITPVPGGVGPMTIAMLLKNCLIAYNHLVNSEPLTTPLESYPKLDMTWTTGT
ncbi:MAG: bifunctional 5,10-methylenetetrahydrofolate dehydrogenase/5,10-methenyltetrahydrofolate cyclohydrolase [Proteobacteria bacterium]|nr:bifunctional 5,10-methylenetetrahydrofolate dehydrogenase/5,10-methenyltetrahydrofolate cyclohydrolase [Pseudomonadota bacterium]